MVRFRSTVGEGIRSRRAIIPREMLHLTDCDDLPAAERLADHLLVAGIDTELRQDARWEVWVLEGDDMARARAVQDGLGGQADDREVRASARAIRASRATSALGRAQRFVAFRERWHVSSDVGMHPITVGLVLVSVIVAWMTHLGDPTTPLLQQLSIEPWGSGERFGRVLAGEPWRLLTPMFIHFGLLHLLFNMSWMLTLGSQIEHNHGPLVMIGVVVASEVVGSVAQYLVVGPNFGGMSGVVYGAFGFVWMHARFGPAGVYTLTDREVVLSMVWFIACATGAFGPIANLGHAGGLVAGLLAGMPPYLRHLKARTTALQETPGTWADVFGTPWRRFRMRVLMPYMPVWFLGIAAVIIAVELL